MRRLFIFLLTFISIQTFAQTPQQREKLLNLADEYSKRFHLEKTYAILLADSLGLPVRQVFEDGTVIELMRFENGFPVFYITENAQGADLINTNSLYLGGSAGLNLSGTGQTLGIWDGGGVRDTHTEFTFMGESRVTQVDDSDTLSDHATHVAGTMIATGVDNAARGMSFLANLLAWDWNDDDAEMASSAANGMNVSNHSYGTVTGWRQNQVLDRWEWYGNTSVSETEDYGFGFYDQKAHDWDEISLNAPNYLIVKSAGNNRGEGPAPGTNHWVNHTQSWSTVIRDLDGGVDGFDSIPTYATAKNILTVGAVNENGNMTVFSGWGPTDDGRIKPDIVAKGQLVYSTTAEGDESYASYRGTSMASPMVSGSIGLLLEHQENLHPGEFLLSSTIKALIIHSADDQISGNPGPDYRFGWGLMDTERAAAIMSENTNSDNIHIHEFSLEDGQEISLFVRATDTEPLRTTIAWIDIPATVPPISLNPSDLMLVNDLDMRIHDQNGIEYMPYILDPTYPDNPALTGDSFLDNVEMIHIEEPIENGVYTITINHKGNLHDGNSQVFSLIVTGNNETFLAIKPFGSGLVGNPYQINSLNNLFWLSQMPSEWDKLYIQTADIDASETEYWFEGAGWSPIGIDIDNHFSGSYNGQNYTIDGLYINRPETNLIGLFGSIDGAIIENLGIINADITGSICTGILAGDLVDSTINNCYSTGSVTGDWVVGGLLGWLDYSEIENCFSITSVSGNYQVGGLVGDQNYSTIINSYSTGSVSGTDWIGGLVGAQHDSSINSSYSSADVTGIGACTGGLVGWQGYSSEVGNSFSTGDVTGETAVGGLVGSNSYNSMIMNSYSIGTVYGNDNVGGLVGEQDDTSVVSRSYYNTETSGQSDSGKGEPRTTAEMTHPYAADTYVDWDFVNIWITDDNYSANNGYPYLNHDFHGPSLMPPRNLVFNVGNGAVNLSWIPPVSLINTDDREYSADKSTDRYNERIDLLRSRIDVRYREEASDSTRLMKRLRTNSHNSNDHEISRRRNVRNLMGYNVYRDGEQINSSLIIDTFYEDTDVVNGVTYSYYITAVYTEGESGFSNTVLVTPGDVFIPTSPEITIDIVEGNVVISWEPVEGATSYRVYSSLYPFGGFEVDNNGEFYGTTWSAPANNNIMFYYVTSVVDEPTQGFEWCLIPAGNYTYGSGNTILNIPYDYEIMKYEVTNAQYLAYLQQAHASGDILVMGSEVLGPYPGDEHYGAGIYRLYSLGTYSGYYNWGRFSFSNGQFVLNYPAAFTEEDFLTHPVVRVTWFGAWHFSQYYGWQLPTEHEWEKAARGMTGYTYPWGNTIEGSRANYRNSGDQYDNGTTPVGFYNGEIHTVNGVSFSTTDSPSPYGVYDLTGNVFNWTNSWWGGAYPNRRVVRGGSWSGPADSLLSWYRTAGPPTYYGDHLGIRCSRTLN